MNDDFNDLKFNIISLIPVSVILLAIVVWLFTLNDMPAKTSTPKTAQVVTQTPTEPPIDTPADTTIDAPTDTPEETQKEDNVYYIGDTWTVPGQWSMTVDSVELTDYRNPYTERQPEAVYYIFYTYENLGFYDETGYWDGLYINLENEMIVDVDGEMGYTYPGEAYLYSEELPIGARCKSEACIGVNHAGDLTFTVIKYDGNNKKHNVMFKVAVPTEITPSKHYEDTDEPSVETENTTDITFDSIDRPYIQE